MSDWLALSDSVSPGPTQSTLDRGLLVVEFSLPLAEPQVLLAHQSQHGPQNVTQHGPQNGPQNVTQPTAQHSLSLFVDPQTGISLLHRRGEQAVRHRLPGALPNLRATARLSFTFDAQADQWCLVVEVIGMPEHARSVLGAGALPLCVADLQAMAIGGPDTRRHPAVLWFGASAALTLPMRAPWIGPRTVIDTSRGPVAATDLRPGDLIATLDQGLLPLHRVIRRRLPSRGSFAPILLRSPFFGLSRDILVSSDQLVLISGASVEYLCGVEEALAPAVALCDGKVAEREQRRAVTDTLALDLGRPALIVSDGCCLLSACETGTEALPRRALAPFETLPLMALLGRTALRHVA